MTKEPDWITVIEGASFGDHTNQSEFIAILSATYALGKSHGPSPAEIKTIYDAAYERGAREALADAANAIRALKVVA